MSHWIPFFVSAIHCLRCRSPLRGGSRLTIEGIFVLDCNCFIPFTAFASTLWSSQLGPGKLTKYKYSTAQRQGKCKQWNGTEKWIGRNVRRGALPFFCNHLFCYNGTGAPQLRYTFAGDARGEAGERKAQLFFRFPLAFLLLFIWC